MEKYRVPGHAGARALHRQRGRAAAARVRLSARDAVRRRHLGADALPQSGHARSRLVPVTMNCTVPPIPTPARAYEVGRALREMLRAYPGPERIAVVAHRRALARAGRPALLLGRRGVRPLVPRPARARRSRGAAARVHARAHGGGRLRRHRRAARVDRSCSPSRAGPADVLAYMPAFAWRSGTGMVVWNERPLSRHDEPAWHEHRLDDERRPLRVEQRDPAAPRDRSRRHGRVRHAGRRRPLLHAGSTHADVVARGPFRGHPLTGPVRVRGARPGRRARRRGPRRAAGARLRLDGDPARAAGCCPRPTSPSRSCRSGTSRDGTHARMGTRVAVPIEPFPGVMGVALDEPGGHSTMPPRKNGGNMDIKQLTAGTTLYLPVLVDGALFSVGDAHARPGRRRGLRHRRRDERPRDAALRAADTAGACAEPQLRTPGRSRAARNRGPYFATTAHGPDLFASAQQAIRYMIEHLVERARPQPRGGLRRLLASPSISRSARSSTRRTGSSRAFLPKHLRCRALMRAYAAYAMISRSASRCASGCAQWQACVRAVDFEAGRKMCAPEIVGVRHRRPVRRGHRQRHAAPSGTRCGGNIREFTMHDDRARGAIAGDHAWVATTWDSLGTRPDGSTFQRPGRCHHRVRPARRPLARRPHPLHVSMARLPTRRPAHRDGSR